MTVEKGRPWGTPGVLADDAPVVRSDAELAAIVARARRSGTELGPVGLLGGDLARTCGSTGDERRLYDGTGHAATVDAAEALVDGVLTPVVAHLVVRRSWWRGRVVAVMNAQFIGPWDVAPRSHPNDGFLDVVDGDPAPSQRWKVRARLRSGTHVPHPDIRIRRTRVETLELGDGTHVYADGIDLGPARTVVVRLIPDALQVVF